MTKLEETIRDEIIEKLEDIEEIEDNAYDLAFQLYEAENYDGTCTYSTYKAMQWIMENFEDLADYVEDYEIEYGECVNPFSNPERFQVIMTMFIARTIIENAWGENKEELIANLREE